MVIEYLNGPKLESKHKTLSAPIGWNLSGLGDISLIGKSFQRNRNVYYERKYGQFVFMMTLKVKSAIKQK